MTQEEKELLLKDLCARLPYKVICTDLLHGDSRITDIDIIDGTVYCDDFDEYVALDKCKLYLRPMSSMTEEERKEYKRFDDFGTSTLRKYEYPDFIVLVPSYDRLDWLLSHHFDFRYPNLISLGLALEAPKDMYNN